MRDKTKTSRRSVLRKIGAVGVVGVGGIGAMGTAAAYHPVTLTITEGSGDGRVEYYVEVENDIDKGSYADSGDTDEGDAADGAVANGGKDSWEVDGGVIQIQADGDGTAVFEFSGSFSDSNKNTIEVNGENGYDSYYTFDIDGNISSTRDLEANDDEYGDGATGYIDDGGSWDHDYYYLSTTSTESLTRFYAYPKSNLITLNKY